MAKKSAGKKKSTGKKKPGTGGVLTSPPGPGGKGKGGKG